MSSFTNETKGRVARPLVGILTSLKQGRQLAGNIPLFRDIQINLSEKGEQSVVFSAEHLHSDTINGVIFDPVKQEWISAQTPIPFIIYNRVPFRKQEQTQAYLKACRYITEKEIPFFNPGFLNKYELYQLLNTDKDISPFILPTIAIQSQQSFHKFLLQHRCIYIKKAISAKGKGISKLELLPDGRILQEDMKRTKMYGDIHSFWVQNENLFQQTWYIAQQEMKPKLYEGKRYDYRIVAVFDGKKHIPIGVGIRQAGKQQITTHLPNGGKILPYSIFQSEEQDRFFATLVETCGRRLTEALGFFAEFSIDLGMSEDGHYTVFEINSKPMSFDEEEIEQARVQALCHLFLRLRKDHVPIV